MASNPPQPPIVRRDIWALETADPANIWDPISLAYAKAIQTMQQRPDTDPTSWAFQTSMHGTYANTPPNVPWNGCQHASWFFLPWHRMYIYWFERIVRSIVQQQGGPADWALPYWNYSKPYPWNTLPMALRAPTLPDGSSNPLYVPYPHRNPSPAPGINGGAQVPPSAASFAKAYGFTNFVPPRTPGFGGGRSEPVQFENSTGALENVPHNVIHDVVGGPASGNCDTGWMSDPSCAAQDPVFWTHHSNIDRLWANWLLLGGPRANPTDSAWLSQQFPFYDEQGHAVTMACRDILDTVAQLNYHYDDAPVPAPHPVPAPAPAAPEPNPGGGPISGGSDEGAQVLATSSAPVSLGVEPSTVGVDMGDSAGVVVGGVASNQASQGRIHLHVEDIQVDKSPGLVYEIYLNAPAASSSSDPSSEHFVGHVTFFGASHHSGHGHGGLRHSYDITDIVRGLTARGQWDPAHFTVTFVPRGLLPPPGQPAVPVAQTNPGASATIGRVSLTTE